MLARPQVKVHNGKRFVLFFGAQNTNGICSNWYKSNFVVEGVTFSCVEQYMMWAKAMLFGDKETASEILKETEPKAMKAYGRKVRNFNSEVWDKEKYSLVLKGVQARFEQNVGLKSWIQAAKADYFVECSPYDAIWGVKLPIADTRVMEPSRWNGENLLGRILKEVQDSIVGGQ